MPILSSTFRRKHGLIDKGLATQGAASTLVGVLPPEFQLHFAPEANVPSDVEAFIPFPYNI